MAKRDLDNEVANVRRRPRDYLKVDFASSPGPGNRWLEITAKYEGQVLFHRAGPMNLVMGLYKKWLKNSGWPDQNEMRGNP